MYYVWNKKKTMQVTSLWNSEITRVMIMIPAALWNDHMDARFSNLKSPRLPKLGDHCSWGPAAPRPGSPGPCSSALGLCSDNQFRAPRPRCQTWNFNPWQSGRLSPVWWQKFWTPSTKKPGYPGLDRVPRIQMDGVGLACAAGTCHPSLVLQRLGGGKDPWCPLGTSWPHWRRRLEGWG